MNSKNVYLAFFGITIIALISARVDGYNYAYAIDHSVNDMPVFMRVLGEGRSIVSSFSILQADRYFHGGAGYHSTEHGEGLAVAERDQKKPDQAEDHVLPKSNPFNILLNISNEIEVTEHIHLSGDQVKEIIPWLYYAAEINPHNILAYTLTAYYLTERIGEIDQGIEFLREGLNKNPDSWEINSELGRIYLDHLGDNRTALGYFIKARELLQKTSHDRFQERAVLIYLSSIYENLGHHNDAVPLYKRLNYLFPDNKIYGKKIIGSSG